RFDEARACHVELKAQRLAAGDRRGYGRVLTNEGIIFVEGLDLPSARRAFEGALAIAAETNDKRIDAVARAGLGNVLDLGGGPSGRARPLRGVADRRFAT